MMREWRTIPGFPDYEIAADGAIRSWRVPSDGRRNHRPMPCMMTPTRTPLGYRAVILRRAGSNKPVRRTLHRLLALVFLPNPQGLSDVAHNDGNPANNRLDNLRWATHRDNQMDMRRHGTMQDGERCCTAKLREAQVRCIRALCPPQAHGMQRRAAIWFRLSRAQVCRIATGKRWASLEAAA